MGVNVYVWHFGTVGDFRARWYAIYVASYRPLSRQGALLSTPSRCQPLGAKPCVGGGKAQANPEGTRGAGCEPQLKFAADPSGREPGASQGRNRVRFICTEYACYCI